MDPAKKAQAERWLVIGLLGVFVVVFVAGPMRTLGWFRPGSPVQPAIEKVPMARPLGAVLETLHTRTGVDAKVESGAGRGPQAPLALSDTVPAYTASALRDPFISLLPPRPQAQAGGTASAAPGSSPAPVTPPPPPTLRVEGVVWGGSAPSAIIDGAVYRLGESVQGMTIVAIDRWGVTVDDAGDRILYPPAAVAPGPGARPAGASGWSTAGQRDQSGRQWR